jgi:transketolase
MLHLRFIPKAEFDRILSGVVDRVKRLEVFSDMCRLNTLVAVKKAGSGHLGSSFSAMDVVCALYLEELNVARVGGGSPDRDVFFSSKGHDVPGLYAVLCALGILPEERLLRLRRIHGLDGHPDVGIPGMEANTGSLGMGISKGRGRAWGKRHFGRGGRVVVMTGDGELQEGQIWESLQTTSHQGTRLTVVVDHNKLQTDMPVEEIVSLRNLDAKFASFGWKVVRCDGHRFDSLLPALHTALTEGERPCVLILDTVKGRGVSFMEEISGMATGQGKYLWHSGAPNDESFQRGFTELQERIRTRLAALGLADLTLKEIPQEEVAKPVVTRQYVAGGYGQELLALAAKHPGLAVLDGDLSADCKIRDFQERFPDRFVENGIAEQDMVSMAGGMARQGLLPVCNSFSSFLCSRANEQIYNNLCEGTKIIYAAHFAGMIPAGPGKSHQSVRDIGLLGSLPGLSIFQPCSVEEATLGTRWAVEEAAQSVCLRLNIGPSPREFALPADYQVIPGRGFVLRSGTDALLFAYGPVMLHEAMLAAELIEKAGVSLSIVNLPWLNRFDTKWLEGVLAPHHHVFTLDDHVLGGGMGERLFAALAESGLVGTRKLQRFGLHELPACGTPWEVLRYHELDGASLARRIDNAISGNAANRTKMSSDGVFDTLEAAQ